MWIPSDFMHDFHAKGTFLLSSRGVKSQGRLSSMGPFHESSPNTDLMKSNYCGVSRGKLWLKHNLVLK